MIKVLIWLRKSLYWSVVSREYKKDVTVFWIIIFLTVDFYTIKNFYATTVYEDKQIYCQVTLNTQCKSLSESKDSKYQEIIKWNNNGTGVEIRNRKELEEKVLHQHFKLKKIASFIRQLHLYGFHKSKTSIETNTFEHPLFTNDEKADYTAIKRKHKEKPLETSKKSEESITHDHIKVEKESEFPQLCSIKSFTFFRQQNRESNNNSIENTFEEWYLKNDEDYSLELDDCMN